MTSEHETADGKRIDICIRDKTRRYVLGIEIKTTRASAEPGQLETYEHGLMRRNPGWEIAIAYLTPFNRQRAGDSAEALPTVRVFEQFAKTSQRARHVNWLDIADIQWDGRDIWRQHQHYVRSKMAAADKLKPAVLQYRVFKDFFGDDAASLVWDALVEMEIFPGPKGARIELENFRGDPSSLSQALIILIEDGENVSPSRKHGRFPVQERQKFLTSPWQRFHAELFELSAQYENVWIQGETDYAVRIAHKHHGSGVSLVRTYGPGVLAIEKLSK